MQLPWAPDGGLSTWMPCSGGASPSDQSVHVRFRIKKVLMPSVPDPKFSFLGLFESHQGNFQVSSISLCKLALGGPNITPLQYFIFSA